MTTNVHATDPRALLAAANNADLYELIFEAQGLNYRRDAAMFLSEGDPPPYYGNMLTLDPDATNAQLAAALALRPTGGSIGVKDGFHRLDLGEVGFDLLFQATWFWAPAERLQGSNGWERVRDAAALTAWEDAWQVAGSPANRRVFPAGLLSEPRIAFLGLSGAHGYDAGCVVNWSDDCIGLSNLFARTVDIEVQAEAAWAAAKLGDGRPIVGYDQGAALQAAIACGFEAVGDLIVWVARA